MLNLSQIFNQSSLCNFIIGCWEVITIDSVQVGKVSGRLNDEQLHSLSQQISSSSAKYIALCLHHPPISMQSDWDDKMSLENPEDLFAVIDQFDNIKAVMWGHAHQCSESNRNGVKLFSCPSTAQFSIDWTAWYWFITTTHLMMMAKFIAKLSGCNIVWIGTIELNGKKTNKKRKS